MVFNIPGLVEKPTTFGALKNKPFSFVMSSKSHPLNGAQDVMRCCRQFLKFFITQWVISCSIAFTVLPFVDSSF